MISNLEELRLQNYMGAANASFAMASNIMGLLSHADTAIIANMK